MKPFGNLLLPDKFSVLFLIRMNSNLLDWIYIGYRPMKFQLFQWYHNSNYKHHIFSKNILNVYQVMLNVHVQLRQTLWIDQNWVCCCIETENEKGKK